MKRKKRRNERGDGFMKIKEFQMNVEEFPTIKVQLPTRNKFYKGLELDDEWEVRGMTVQEQKMMLSMNQQNQDDVLQKIVYNCITYPENQRDYDLFIVDRDQLLYQIRILTYGSEVDIEFTCNNCGQRNKKVVSLDSLETKFISDKFNLPIKWKTKYITVNKEPVEFEFTLPTIQTTKDIQKLQKLFGQDTVQERSLIFYIGIFGNLVQVNGEPVTLQEKKQLIEMFMKLPQKVMNELIDLMRFDVGIQTTYPQTCDQCGQENDVFVLNQDFFFPIK